MTAVFPTEGSVQHALVVFGHGFMAHFHDFPAFWRSKSLIEHSDRVRVSTHFPEDGGVFIFARTATQLGIRLLLF